ncbi:MAG: DUF2797 domain-containing protein [Halieaceae bacterium]|nr:DUF2797 domain-containing protein [Halieaceae bacterium]
MTQNEGCVAKMRTELGDVVQYALPLGDQVVALNPLIGQTVRLEFTGFIQCVACSRLTKKSFNQGYCYPCFKKLAQCDMCIMSPERCHFAAGTCREPEWGEANCNIDHFVYLANTSGLKVGITRHSQIPTRWIDQGASQALPIARVSSRYLSGLLEVQIGKSVADKTAWQTMLKGAPEPIGLVAKRDEIKGLYATELDELQNRHGLQSIQWLEDQNPVDIRFPVTAYPEKVKALNFDKQVTVEGCLLGIKGQYLIFDTGVLNIRKFGGYELRLSY